MTHAVANKTFTLKLATSIAPDCRALFVEHEFEIREAPHALWQARGPGCNATFYKSGKLLLQGAEADVWRGLIGDLTPDARPYHRALSKHPKPPPNEWIGTDEAGKGDYFGPLVVAGVALERSALEVLQTLGVDDSKQVADSRMTEMVPAIRALGPCEELLVSPTRYNELYATIGNLNHLLAWAHGKVIESLLERSPARYVLVDQFAHLTVIRRALGPRGRAASLEARTRAEEDPAVAAASVLARAAYLRWLSSASRRYGVKLTPGAGPPVLTAGRKLLELHGDSVLGQLGKLHFATTDTIRRGR